MKSLLTFEETWRVLLEESARRNNVPGATMAVLRENDFLEVAIGVTNVQTRWPVTPTTVFQIASITKVFTATLIMQLVDAGLVDLDTSVQQYLPTFRLADDTAHSITVRHLLSHTSGIPSEHYEDFGRGDDCVERFVASLSADRLVYPAGTMFSYSNTGLVVAGRLIEVVTGLTWDAALRQRILDPLALHTTFTLPEDVLIHPAAIGHQPDPHTGEPLLVHRWYGARAVGPAGIISMTAADLVRFAQMHLHQGKGPNGTHLLSKESVRAMQEAQISVPGMQTKAWGLGWNLPNWGDVFVVGHNGDSPGQAASLRLLPKQNIAIAILTNSLTGFEMSEEVLQHVARDLVSIEFPRQQDELDETVATSVNLTKYAGVYAQHGVRYECESKQDGLTLTKIIESVPMQEWAGLWAGPTTFHVRSVDASRFVGDIEVFFLEKDAFGRPRYLHDGNRAFRRRSEALL